jgi:hypothetical protein
VDRTEHFMRYVAKSEDGCWEWTGYRIAAGYGKVTILGTRRKDLAHRVSYRLFVGPIPDGLTIDHLCRNTGCVRPDHLEPVTLRENIRRANPERTTCRHGHSLEDAYIDVTPAGFRHKKCRTCVLARVRRRRERLAGSNSAA